MENVWLFWKIYLLMFLIGTGICIIWSVFITIKEYQDYWKKVGFKRLLHSFDKDEVEFYTQIFNKIQQIDDSSIKLDQVNIIVDNIVMSYYESHNCMSIEIKKNSYDRGTLIFPDDHNREVLNYLTNYAYDKAFKLKLIEIEKNQKDLIESNKRKIKDLLKEKE